MKWLLLVLAAACGDNTPIGGHFVVVGHSDLSGRGMNGGLAVDGQLVYVGSRNDRHGVAIVDVADPAHPRISGEIGRPQVAFPGQSTREVRVVRDKQMLAVLVARCSVDEDGCQPCSVDQGGCPPEGLGLFDLSGPLPSPAGFVDEGSSFTIERHPRELFLWRDPTMPDLVIAYVSTPPGPPALDAVDLQVRFDPASFLTYPIPGNPDGVLQSISTSDDGRIAFFSHQQGGLLLADLSEVVDGTTPPLIRMLTPPGQGLTWPGIGPTSAVPVPGRPLLVVTEGILPEPYGTGCPWGHLRMVDISDPTSPAIVGEFALPENEPAMCVNLPANTAYTAHDATVTEHVALVSWYAGGLQAIDISDPEHPAQLAEFRPDPIPSVEVEDPVLGGVPVEMWSYPVIQDGLIYVVDSRNGLYILRYEGWLGDEIEQRRFLEGNSNLGAYMPRR